MGRLAQKKTALKAPTVETDTARSFFDPIVAHNWIIVEAFRGAELVFLFTG